MTSHQKAIAQRLERIARRNGGILTPDAVIEDAQDKASPLHDQFTWDDTEAAKQWRLEQARSLIRSVKIEIKTDERTVSTVRYIRNPEASHREQGYADVTHLRTREDLAREALRRELAAAKALFERCESLAEAFQMQEEVIELRNRIVGMEGRLQIMPLHGISVEKDRDAVLA